MTNYAETAFSVVRLFLWEKLKESNILAANDYIADGFITPLIPIIPVQQVPEFNNLIGNKPYIIYDYDIQLYSEEWWICEEKLVFTIVASNFEKIIEITQFMIDLFRRMDESAGDLNKWQTGSKFKFFTFILSGAQSPTPYEEEGGRQMGEVSVTYRYSRELDSYNRFL